MPDKAVSGTLNKVPLVVSAIQRAGIRCTGTRGLALLLVMFIVALCSILVVNLTHSTYLGSRIGSTAERSVQAEYILKSALSFARALIKNDRNEEDSYQDDWGKFANGIPIPPELLGMQSSNMHIFVEIRPEGAKMNVKSLVPRTLNGQPDIKWRGVLTRLFENLGFGEDDDADPAGPGQGTVFSPRQMVANLIDYMDADNEPYNTDGYQGIENNSTEFPNTQISRMGELASVPGFTPARIQKLTPFLTTRDNLRININLAPKLLLLSLHEDLTEAQVDEIIAFRNSEDGPFESITRLRDFINDDTIYNEISSLVTERSNWFQVLAKVDYSTSSYFMRAYLSKTTRGQLPNIQSIELF